jgi:hypothetical protein
MLRMIAIAAMLALALPSLAVAQQPPQHHPPGKPAMRSGGGGPPPGGGNKAFVRPGPGAAHVGPMAGPHGGGPVGAQFSYRGHMINRIHATPFAYPPGWAYRRWAAGAILPPLFLAPAFYYADWAALGVAAPEPGFQWVRYGPDLVLVNVSTGEIVDVVYGAFY